MSDKKPIEIQYDIEKDLVIIEGQTYSGDFFRAFSPEVAGDFLFRFHRDEHGAVSINKTGKI